MPTNNSLYSFTNDLGDTFEYTYVIQESNDHQDIQRVRDVVCDESRGYLGEIGRLSKIRIKEFDNHVLVTSLETNLGFTASIEHRIESLNQFTKHLGGNGLLMILPRVGMWIERAESIASGVVPEELNPGYQKFMEKRIGNTGAESMWNTFGEIGFFQVMDNDLDIPKPGLCLTIPFSEKKGLIRAKKIPTYKLSELLRATKMGENRFLTVMKNPLSKNPRKSVGGRMLNQLKK